MARSRVRQVIAGLDVGTTKICCVIADWSPDAAIAVPVGDGFKVQKRLRVTMSCDHRVVDGAVGAAFLQTLRRLIENPLMMVF